MSVVDNNVPNPEVNLRPFPWYEIHFLDVGDADCIAIKYQQNSETNECIVLVDAGNVSDYEKVKAFLKDTFGSTKIDLAVCTHPDSDHKGGFFGLLEDADVDIREFWIKNPACYLCPDDFTKMRLPSTKIKACERIYNHPTDPSKNLLSMAREKVNSNGIRCNCRNVECGMKHTLIPLEPKSRETRPLLRCARRRDCRRCGLSRRLDAPEALQKERVAPDRLG